ncbi:MAG: hypothetical protein N2043_01775 [Ignavibacterium sp.]|nr:hypothetical protein [Ignavibacterium sp.]
MTVKQKDNYHYSVLSFLFSLVSIFFFLLIFSYSDIAPFYMIMSFVNSFLAILFAHWARKTKSGRFFYIFALFFSIPIFISLSVIVIIYFLYELIVKFFMLFYFILI